MALSELTRSPFYTGLAGFLFQAPHGLQFLDRRLVERWPLREVLIGTQLLEGILGLIVPIAAWTGHLSVGVLLILVPILTVIAQFGYPAQTAALPRIVEEPELTKANSIFSVAHLAANSIFNAVNGLLISAVGAITIFLLDTLSFAIAVMLVLGPVYRVKPLARRRTAAMALEGNSSSTLRNLEVGSSPSRRHSFSQ